MAPLLFRPFSDYSLDTDVHRRRSLPEVLKGPEDQRPSPSRRPLTSLSRIPTILNPKRSNVVDP